MNRNDIVQFCSKDLALSRSRAQNQAYFNLNKARQSKKFQELEHKEKLLTFEIGKLRAFNQDFSQHQQKLEEIKQAKKEVLSSLGLTDEDLIPKYKCSKCDDNGFVHGKACSCLKAKINAYILKISGAGKDTLNTFKAFDENLPETPEHKNILLKLKKKFEQYAETFPNQIPHYIVLSGKTGVGKTFLTECLASEIINKGYLVSFISAFGMNNLFTSYHTTFDSQKPAYLNSLLDPDLLIIDDLGTEPILRNITKEYLYLILSERSRLNKTTIITTNLGPLELMNRYNERIFSRLFHKQESFTSQIVGTDLRLIKK